MEWNSGRFASHMEKYFDRSKGNVSFFYYPYASRTLEKIKHSNPFQFESASIGNFFLTGARLFLGSLDASIELMMRIGRCSPLVHVIPCINTNHTHHISALLTNGEMITGQSQISHPSKSVPKDNSIAHSAKFIHLLGSYDDHLKILLDDEEEEAEEEYANPIYILPELKTPSCILTSLMNHRIYLLRYIGYCI